MTRLILASGSKARAAMLRAVGLEFGVCPAAVDEERIRVEMREEPDLSTIADALAAAKALEVSRRMPGALAIGGDQILLFDGRLIEKSPTLAAARALLAEMRGREHLLVSACTLAKDGAQLWRCRETARLKLRLFDDSFLDAYLQAEGEGILDCVGAFRLEGRGVQLFERLEGDYFTILGLPLLPLLAALREQGVLE
jgi:septum formation protein